MVALLALSGALLWGAGDFLGGLAARRVAVLTVLAISQAIGLAGVAALSWEPSSPGRRPLAAGAGLAVVAALGFGAFVVGLDAGSDESAPWAVVAARSTSVTIAVAAAIVLSTSLRAPRSLLPILVGVAAFDTGANVCVAFATTKGAVGVVAVLSALYPVVTVVLARLVLAERLSGARRVGGGVAIAGAALVAAG